MLAKTKSMNSAPGWCSSTMTRGSISEREKTWGENSGCMRIFISSNKFRDNRRFLCQIAHGSAIIQILLDSNLLKISQSKAARRRYNNIKRRLRLFFCGKSATECATLIKIMSGSPTEISVKKYQHHKYKCWDAKNVALKKPSQVTNHKQFKEARRCYQRWESQNIIWRQINEKKKVHLIFWDLWSFPLLFWKKFNTLIQGDE